MLNRKLTGIFIRAKIDERMGSYDICDLPWEVTEEWLKKSVESKNTEYAANCANILVDKLVDLLTFIECGVTTIDPDNIRKNLYGDSIEQCRQCLALLNLLADAFGIDTKAQDDLQN